MNVAQLFAVKEKNIPSYYLQWIILNNNLYYILQKTEFSPMPMHSAASICLFLPNN